MIGSSLVKAVYLAHQGNYTAGRKGKIEKVTLHHMAARWTAKRCGELFQTPGRKGSSHYGIGYEGEIAQYVSEGDTAWSDSNWESNLSSVSIECANETMGEPWPVSDSTLESLALLLADISLRNHLGPYKKGENLTWHQMYSATACPGAFLLSKMDEIAERANKLIANGMPAAEKKREVTVSYQVFTDQWLGNIYRHDPKDPIFGYAGIFGQGISGLFVNADVGNVFYQAHIKGGQWLPEVKNREDFAGILGREMDGVMIRGDNIGISYQVHTKEDGWLGVIRGYDKSDPQNGYAGILGHTIDGIMIWADPILAEETAEKNLSQEEVPPLPEEEKVKESEEAEPEEAEPEEAEPEEAEPEGAEPEEAEPEEAEPEEAEPEEAEPEEKKSKKQRILEILKNLFHLIKTFFDFLKP